MNDISDFLADEDLETLELDEMEPDEVPFESEGL